MAGARWAHLAAASGAVPDPGCFGSPGLSPRPGLVGLRPAAGHSRTRPPGYAVQINLGPDLTIFHFGRHTIAEAKTFLAARGIAVRSPGDGTAPPG